MNRKLWTKIGLGAVGVTAVAALSGCSGLGKFTEPFKDAPRSNHDTSNPMDVIQMSDGFSNVGTSCDGHGNRVYVAYHGDKAYASIFVVPQDSSCR